MTTKQALLTKHYQVLFYLYERKNNFNEAMATQAEIVECFDLAVATVNKIFRELKESGLICVENNYKGRYKLTNQAIQFVQNTEMILGGND